MTVCRAISVMTALLLSIASLSAQTIDIKGTVTDENGDPMHGCYIHTSESKYTMTDVLGHYSIPISYGKTVKIHYECIGYCDVVLTFSPERAFPPSPDVKMVPDSTAIDDLPAVGLPYVDLADKTGPCPRCGSEKVLPILYGITTQKGYEAIRNGEYVSGGSMVGRANYACASCEQRFYVREAPSIIENTRADSLMVVVDGIGYVAPVESDLVLQSFSFISDEDIESIDLLKKDSPFFATFNRPKDILLLTTRKESEIHDFYLDGQAVHKKKGIRLGYLFDESLLKQQIKKNWKINPDRITSLSVNGREIRIKTK